MIPIFIFNYEGNMLTDYKNKTCKSIIHAVVFLFYLIKCFSYVIYTPKNQQDGRDCKTNWTFQVLKRHLRKYYNYSEHQIGILVCHIFGGKKKCIFLWRISNLPPSCLKHQIYSATKLIIIKISTPFVSFHL